MIIDQSRRLRGISISRLSEYLSLCKIECLVRNATSVAPSRRVDQPSKVGQAGTMAKPESPARPCYSIKFNSKLKTGNRDLTLLLKKELSKKLRINIESLSEVGTAILQQDGEELEHIPVYGLMFRADNFAKQCKEVRFCLSFDKQEQWVNAFLRLLRKQGLQSYYLMVISQGQIRNYKVPESQGGN